LNTFDQQLIQVILSSCCCFCCYWFGGCYCCCCGCNPYTRVPLDNAGVCVCVCI